MKRDFDVLFAAAPDAYLAVAADLTVLAANAAYFRATSTREEDVVGRSLFDAFPDDPMAPGPAALARASLERVIESGLPDVLVDLRYPLRSERGFEERWWSTTNTPVLDGEGRVAWVLHRVADVTDAWKQAATLFAATQQSALYSQLLDMAPDAIIIVGDDGNIRLVNVRAESLFGYARHELVGQPLARIIPERFRAAHAVHMARYFADPRVRPMGSALELLGLRKDGDEIPIEVSLSPQSGTDGMTVSAAVRDVSERERLRAAECLAAARLSSAIESMDDAIALFGADDRLLLCNSVFRALVHAAAETNLVGRPYVEILDSWIGDVDVPDEAARTRFRAERLAHRLRETTSSFDVQLTDGRSLRVSDRRTEEGGTVKTIWDLTSERHRAVELREARAAAEAASAAKSEFLSSMSHELRTPMNAILGFAQLLERDKREPLSARHKERVEQILRGGAHLLRLIDDILDLSRIEAGSVTLSPEPVDVREVLDEVRRTLEPIAARQGIVIDSPPADAVLGGVVADRTRFAQILINFGSNAIKYNRPGGTVRFGVTSPREGVVRVSLTDTGIGIPAPMQSKLFQPFQRAGQEAGPIEGTGIGLVITKRLAELMGGEVGFESIADEGSMFWVELRRHDAEVASAPLLSRGIPSTELDGSAARHLVLYIEDNPANVVFMKDLMSSFESVELQTLPNAELGVEIARARHPAIILMDINLPGMSGLDALRVLKADASTKDIPVIALTAAAFERDRQRGIEAGFHRYLTKPIDVDELVDVMDRLLSVKGES